MAKQAAEIIAFHLGWDVREVRDARYQPTRYASPAVYSIGDHYYCCPSKPAQRMPMGSTWDYLGSYYGRSVFRVHMNEVKG